MLPFFYLSMKSYAIELEIQHAGDTHAVSLEVYGEVVKDLLMYPNENVEITKVVIHEYEVVACEPPLTNARQVINRSYIDEIEDLFFQEFCNDDNV